MATMLLGVPLRLWSHTLVALVLFGFGVAAPILLLLRDTLGLAAQLTGLALLVVGSASIFGAILSRAVDRSSCTRCQWGLLLGGAWLLNPVLIVVVSTYINRLEILWWSSMPLALVLVIVLAGIKLHDGDPDWHAYHPNTHLVVLHWIFSRIVFIILPMCLLSFQVALYLPDRSLLPTGPSIGLFVCGGCVLISAKFCLMCGCLSNQLLAQAFVLALMLAGDWISCLNLMDLVKDTVKVPLLLSFLLAAGLLQSRLAFVRLHLRLRWARAREQRRVRNVRQLRMQGQDLEMGLNINQPTGDSTDSDDDNGPGSLPDDYHQAFAGILGLAPSSSSMGTRQFLCSSRTASIRVLPTGEARSQTGEQQKSSDGQPGAPQGNCVGVSPARDPQGDQDSSTQPPTLEIPATSPTDIKCTICLEEIKTGDCIRPMPKCNHVFHKQCLDTWICSKREDTKCPTCRRPALSRREIAGGDKISDLLPGSEQAGNSSPFVQALPRVPSGASSGRPGLPRRPPGQPQGRRVIPPQRMAAGIAELQHLGVTVQMAQAAMECAGGAPEVAAHILLELATSLPQMFPRGYVPATPAGVVEAIVQAHPMVQGLEANLRRHLDQLYRSRRLQSSAWNDLSEERRIEVFRVLLEDLVRRLEERRA